MGLCRPADDAPRATPTSDLVQIVAEHLPSFLERVEEAGGALPKSVADELRGLLRQSVLSFRSPLSVRLGYDSAALGLVGRSLARHIGHRRLSWARLLARVFTTEIKCTRPRRRGASGLDHASVPPVARPYLRSCR